MSCHGSHAKRTDAAAAWPSRSADPGAPGGCKRAAALFVLHPDNPSTEPVVEPGPCPPTWRHTCFAGRLRRALVPRQRGGARVWALARAPGGRGRAAAGRAPRAACAARAVGAQVQVLLPRTPCTISMFISPGSSPWVPSCTQCGRKWKFGVCISAISAMMRFCFMFV